MNARPLTVAEAAPFAARLDVKRQAVMNFLTSMPPMSVFFTKLNAIDDGRSYGWNDATLNAIKDGIDWSAKNLPTPKEPNVQTTWRNATDPDAWRASEDDDRESREEIGR